MSSPSPSIEVTEPPRRFSSGVADGVRPSHHLNDTKTKFTNPWPSFRIQTLYQLLPFLFKLALRTPSPPQDIKSLIPSQTPTWGTTSENESRAKATWLGHACYLVELPTPPGAARGWFGPARYTDPPCKVEDVPAVDAIVLSHNHYDHTDIPTLRSLLTKPSSSPNVFVPLNNASYLSSALSIPLSRFHELDWWDERILRVPLPSNTNGPAVNAEVRLSCTPSQHVSGRTATDKWRALWSSWAVEDLRSLKKLYFAGDTGYRTVHDGEDEDNVPVCPAFAEIGERFGGFNVALLPIGAYNPRAVMSSVHASPADAVRIFKDLRAKKALAMHWGTWVLTLEPALEPPAVLKKECEKAAVDPDDFFVPALGETFFF